MELGSSLELEVSSALGWCYWYLELHHCFWSSYVTFYARKTLQTSRLGLFHLYLLQLISEQGRCLFLRLASNFFCSVSRSLSILLLILHILLLTCLFTINNTLTMHSRRCSLKKIHREIGKHCLGNSFVLFTDIVFFCDDVSFR